MTHLSESTEPPKTPIREGGSGQSQPPSEGDILALRAATVEAAQNLFGINVHPDYAMPEAHQPGVPHADNKPANAQEKGGDGKFVVKTPDDARDCFGINVHAGYAIPGTDQPGVPHADNKPALIFSIN